MPKIGLASNDFKDAAKILNCKIAAIRAVAEVESRGGGFLDSGEPVILFERHIFSQRTKGVFDKSYPEISNPKRGGYGKYSEQHAKLARASKLNRTAALQSASWGMFQIMGFNFTLCGYTRMQDFVNAMYRSERDHLLSFVEYIRQTFLADEMRSLKWEEFARKYNGPDYKKNEYDVKLAKAYKKYA